MPTMLQRACAAVAITCAMTGLAHASTINLNPAYANDLTIAAPTRAAQLIYAPNSNMLVQRNSGSVIQTINIGTGQTTRVFANRLYTDISLSPSGNYVYASDYGGEMIGYGTPASPSYVTRLDLAAGTSFTAASPIAGNIEATSDNTFVLKTSDQWIYMTHNSWTSGNTVQQLNPSTDYANSGYYAWVYNGNIVYDPTSSRIIHGGSGSSSSELHAFKVVGDSFVKQEGSGTYGSASGYGGTVVISSDARNVYYGALQVDALDVSHNQLVFPELIYAANSQYAFGNGAYYDAKTGTLIGKLGFNTTVYAMNPNGNDFWAYDDSTSSFKHFSATVPEASSWSMMALGLIGLTAVRRRANRLAR
jgi:hypothetical protein